MTILPTLALRSFVGFDKDIEDAREMLNDSEMKAFAQSEIDNGKEQLERIKKRIKKFNWL